MWILPIIVIYKTRKVGGVNDKYEGKLPNVHAGIFWDVLAFLTCYVYVCGSYLILISAWLLFLNIKYISLTDYSKNQEKNIIYQQRVLKSLTLSTRRKVGSRCMIGRF